MADQTTTVTVTTNTPGAAPIAAPPVGRIKTHRGVIKVILLSILTLGIYGIAFRAGIGNDMNVIASRYDGKKTMNYWLMALVISPLTLFIGYLVWNHNLAKRIGAELKRRGIHFSFGAGTFWFWNIVGLLFAAGPFIYTSKLCKAMNKLAKDYNEKG